MEWWQIVLIVYGCVGLAIALPVIMASVRISARPGGRKFSAGMVVGVLLFAVFWPLIVLPLVMVIRKARRAQRELGESVMRAMQQAQQGQTGRIIDVEKK